MKDHFLLLLDYDRHTNLQMVQNIFTAGEPLKAVQIMAHVIAAQNVWLLRATEDDAPMPVLWPDWQTVQFTYLIEDSYTKWTAFIEGLTDADMTRIITYRNSRGETFDNKLKDILTHVINHGTHHRAQIGQIVKQAGLEHLAASDLIIYLRSKDQ